MSALADHVEIVTLKRGTLTYGELEDLIRERGWDLDEGYEGPASSVNDAQLVLDRVQQRRALLGIDYPFETDGKKVIPASTGSGERYLGLLAIAWAHVRGVKSPSPEIEFENLVLDVLRAKGLLSSGLRSGNGFAGKFEQRLKNAASILGMQANPAARPYAKRANDEGGDAIAVFDWGDRRMGRWWLIGQVTCARSDDWISKLGALRTNDWSDWLSEKTHPIKFLAVPHHVPDTEVARITEMQSFVLDRLRLATVVRTVSVAEKKLIKLMRS